MKFFSIAFELTECERKYRKPSQYDGRSMGGVRGGLEKLNPLIIRHLSKDTGGLG